MRERWRSTSPTSSSDAPLRSMSVARLWRSRCEPTYFCGGFKPVLRNASSSMVFMIWAFLKVMARLGLRAPEVIAIQLDDIDWRSGEILIRGKGKLHDRMPLPADVGEAIVDYLKNGRPGNSRTLFVSAKTPHPPFKNAQILNT